MMIGISHRAIRKDKENGYERQQNDSDYRTADCQLGFAQGGFGCTPGARGRAVYFEELYSGERCRWDASDILGVANPEKIPDWAKEKLREYEQKRTEPKKERGEAR